MDVLWKQHTAHRLDPTKYLPIEIVNLIFSFVVYHVVDLEPKDHVRQRGNGTPRNQIANFQDGPLILTSVSRYWCQIAVDHPPLWSTILIDQSEDCLERIHLFLDRSGKQPLDIILFNDAAPTIHLKDLLLEHADRFKALIGHLAWDVFPCPPSRLEPLEASPGFVNWSEYPSRCRGIPIPKCLHRIQLHHGEFDPESLIQFTFFHNLESLFITIQPRPNDIQWDKKLRLERLRYLYLRISDVRWIGVSPFTSSFIEWLECPALENLYLFYSLIEGPSEEMYPQLEASVLRFRYLQTLQVDIFIPSISPNLDESRFQNMRPSRFEGSIECVHLTFGISPGEIVKGAWAAAFTERFFSVFVPKSHLTWPYAQFPSPAITPNIKTMNICGPIEGVQNALVAPEMAKLEFPFLEELNLQRREPKWMNLLHAPRLTCLSIDWFIPSDLRHISRSIVSSIYLTFSWRHSGSLEIFLPSADKLEVALQVEDIFHLNVHASQIHAVTINVHWNKTVTYPPYWTIDHISSMLGNVTELVLIRDDPEVEDALQDPLETVLTFIKPFAHLKHLTLFPSRASEHAWIDQLAEQLVDPSFLPKLESLSISDYPSWPDFFQYIQQRQSGFLAGHFQTALKRITIRKPVHGVLLEHLRESLAGKYIGLINMPSRRKGSKDWPTQPFDYRKLDGDGLLCCYVCHKAGLEIGCMITLPTNPEDMHMCERHSDAWPLYTVLAP